MIRLLSDALRMTIMTVVALAAFEASASVNEGARDEEGIIRIKPVVEIDGKKNEIMLGDLIVPHGVPHEALEKLQKVRLADTPKPGESRSFTGVGLEQLFHQHLRDIKSAAHISVRVPARVTVVRKSFRLSREDVESELRRRMKDFCGDCNFEINELRLPAVPTSVPAGSTWTIRFRNEIPKGNFSVPLEVANEDGSRRTYWISGSVLTSRKVLVASRSIAIGEKLRSEDVSQQTKDLTFSTDVAATESDISFSIAARQIAAGQIIWRSSLKRETAVKSGDIVKVVAGSEGWQVSVDGVAQGAAYVGDVVKVKIPRTQKLVSGSLIENGIVEVR